MADSLRTFTGVLLAVATAVFTVAAVIIATQPWAARRILAGYAMRSNLPVPDATAPALERYVRGVTWIECACIAVAAAVCGGLLLSPLGDSPTFVLTVFLPAVLLASLLGKTGFAVHQRLFRPTVGGVRVARSRTVTRADYLPAARRALSWVLVAASAASTAWLIWWLTHADIADAATAAPSLVLGVTALLGCAAMPLVERAVLQRPQPAASPIELAWDDELRASALNAWRQACAVLCLLACITAAMCILTAPTGGLGAAPFIIVVGQIVLGRIYPTNGAPLSRRLHPQGILRPAGSAA